MNNTESVLKTPVTREVALKFSNDVFDKRTTWEKEAVRFNIDGATLRRYCVELL